MWRMSAVYLARIIGSVHPCLADVMDEYRDPKFTGGYLSVNICSTRQESRTRNPMHCKVNMTCIRISPTIHVFNMRA